MNKSLFTERILIKVAQAIRSGKKPFDKERLIDEITTDCFADEAERESWRPIVAQRIELLLTNEGTFISHIRHACRHCEEGRRRCTHVCPTDAIIHTDNGVAIDWDRCIECGRCVDGCISGAIVARSDFARVASC